MPQPPVHRRVLQSTKRTMNVRSFQQESRAARVRLAGRTPRTRQRLPAWSVEMHESRREGEHFAATYTNRQVDDGTLEVALTAGHHAAKPVPMPIAQVFRHDEVDWLTDGFSRRMAEELLGSGVPEDDPAVLASNNDRVLHSPEPPRSASTIVSRRAEFNAAPRFCPSHPHVVAQNGGSDRGTISKRNARSNPPIGGFRLAPLPDLLAADRAKPVRVRRYGRSGCAPNGVPEPCLDGLRE